MPDNKTQSCYGLALDLGTMVVKGCVVDLHTKRIIRVIKKYNQQNALGTNVISRISKALQGNNRLRNLLFATITEIKKEMGIFNPCYTTVVGNSVMESFYLNKSVSGLAKFPFRSAIKCGEKTKNPQGYVFPVIGGFVGGDTIAGILASDIYKKNKNYLYIDLGTNGEVVLIKNRKIYAVSTAAGPAFEGVGISAGTLAIPGAIKRFYFHKKKLTFTTINNKKPIGICASGLLSLLTIMLKQKWLKDNGQLVRPMNLKGFKVTQQDVRKIQLAIAAIHAGVKILLMKANLKPSDIYEVIITGEFGDKLNKSILVRLGLIPQGIKKIRFEDNLPLKGAVAILLNRAQIKQVEAIRKSSTHIELALEKDFPQVFIQAMNLSPWN
ncbi:MAG: ASKHA domain-containing protein [candidate division WOR-3 bacterium]|nr:ASKHA domain-containing protein [candidate division WOR-3 bacterium]